MGPKRKPKEIPKPVAATRASRGAKPEKTEPKQKTRQEKETTQKPEQLKGKKKIQKLEPTANQEKETVEKPEPKKITKKVKKTIENPEPEQITLIESEAPLKKIKPRKSTSKNVPVNEPEINKPGSEVEATKVRVKAGKKKKVVDIPLKEKDECVLMNLEDKTNDSESIDDEPITEVKVGARRKRGMIKPTGEESPTKKFAQMGKRNVGFTACLEKPSSCSQTSKPESALAVKPVFSTLSTQLEKLKSNPRIGNKKSLCSKAILNLLENLDPETENVKEPSVPVAGAGRKRKSLLKVEKPPEPDPGPEHIPELETRKKRIAYARAKKAELDPKPRRGTAKSTENNTIRSSPRKSILSNPKEMSFNQTSSQGNTSLSTRVPIWKKSVNLSQMEDVGKKDVFDPNCYGVEEFGPEDDGAVKKKTRRKKKKDNKGILVFGNQGSKKDIEKVVKETHHLKTPVAKRKPAKNIPKIVMSEFCPPPAPSQQRPPPRTEQSGLGYSSDFSMGAHNFFDSADQIPQIEMSVQNYSSVQYSSCLKVPNRSKPKILRAEPEPALPTSSVQDDPVSYKTPSVPKTFSKLLKNDKSSTPKLEPAKPKEPESIKEQIQNAFGFDDTDDDELSGSESMSLSPVKNMSGIGGKTVMDVSRVSALHSFREASKPTEKDKIGMYRFNGVPTQNGIMRQVAAILKNKVDESISNQIRKHEKGRRSSPRKKKPIQPSQPNPSQPRLEPEPEKDIGSSTLFIEDPEPEDRVDLNIINPTINQDENSSQDLEKESHSPKKVLAPRNAFEVLKSGKGQRKPAAKTKIKKLTKKVSKNPKLEQSSILESMSSTIASKINGKDLPRKRVQTKKKNFAPSPERKNSSDKENAGKELETSVLSGSRTYRPKKDKPSVSFDQSIPSSPKQKKPTQKEKKLDHWAALQTSHFSEVEEFDLSFA